MRIVIAPPVPALLPAYASLNDPVAELRAACPGAIAWLGPSVRVLADDSRSPDRGGARCSAAAPTSDGRDLLVMANGSARRSEKAPGHLDPRAAGYDDWLEQLLRLGDLGGLAALDIDEGEELLATGLRSLAVLAKPRRARGDDRRGAGGPRRRAVRRAVLGGEVAVRVLIGRGLGSATSPTTTSPALYAAPRSPWLRVNMVSTLDGAATGSDGRSGGINDDADHRVFDTLRRLADCIVVGAGTARAEGYRPARAPLVLVSRSGEVPELLRGAEPGRVRLATTATSPGLAEARDAARRRARLGARGPRRWIWSRCATRLAAQGWRELLSEGGPRLLGDLLAGRRRRRALPDHRAAAGRRDRPADHRGRAGRRTARADAAARARAGPCSAAGACTDGRRRDPRRSARASWPAPWAGRPHAAAPACSGRAPPLRPRPGAR